MSNEMEHMYKANHDEDFLIMTEKVDNKLIFIDWRYIALYYSALHFGDAYLARKKRIISVKNHQDRIQKYGKILPSDAFASYKILEARSKIARYHPEMSNVLSDSDFRELYTKHFPKLKSLI